MKRRFLIIALAMVLVFAFASVSFADDTEVTQDQATCDSEMTYTKNSSFSVLIPATIDLNTGYTFSTSYTDLLDTDQVNVYMETLDSNNMFALTKGGTEYNFTMQNVGLNKLVASFNNEKNFTPNIYAENVSILNAGEYTGTATFKICLVTKGTDRAD